jgi:hypothetical protein
MSRKPRDLNHERNHKRPSAGAMRSRKRDLEDKAMERDMEDERDEVRMTLDDLADLLDNSRPLSDRVRDMLERSRAHAADHEALMADEEDGR